MVRGNIFEVPDMNTHLRVLDKDGTHQGYSQFLPEFGVEVVQSTPPYKEIRLLWKKLAQDARYSNYKDYNFDPMEVTFKDFQRFVDKRVNKLADKGINVYLSTSNEVNIRHWDSVDSMMKQIHMEYEYAVPEDRVYDSIFIEWPTESMIDEAIRYALTKYK